MLPSANDDFVPLAPVLVVRRSLMESRLDFVLIWREQIWMFIPLSIGRIAGALTAMIPVAASATAKIQIGTASPKEQFL